MFTDSHSSSGHARWIPLLTELENLFRACLETTRGAAARDFGCGQGGLGRSQRPAAGCKERANAGHGQKAVWLRCSVVAARSASFVAPSGLLPENRPPANFKAGSQGKSSVIFGYLRLFPLILTYLR